jgi:DNA-binding response OmpR family regulator
MVKALVVDDERHVARLLEFMLEKNGYQVSVAYDGREALDKASEVKPDVILLDLVLPGLSGMEVLKQLRDDPQFNDVKILILTGHGYDANSDGISGIDADAYCTKPLAPSTLLTRLSDLGVGPV